jgi:hypothetical protein
MGKNLICNIFTDEIHRVCVCVCVFTQIAAGPMRKGTRGGLSGELNFHFRPKLDQTGHNRT